VRFLRFLGLLAAIAAAYFAQYIFDYRSLAQFFPQRLLQWMPGLAEYSRWLSPDLLMLALFLAIMGGLGFGLLAPAWRGVVDGRRSPGTGSEAGKAVSGMERARLYLLISGLGALLLLLLLWARPGESIWGGIIWLLSLVSLFLTLRILDRASPPRSTTTGPRGGWWGIAAILVAAGLLFGWRLAAVPTSLGTGLSRFGLAALGMASGQRGGFFTPGPLGLPWASHGLTALFMLMGRNVLLELRLSGFVAGMVAVFATWLLGREIFLRPLSHTTDNEFLEDDGGWMALLAAALLAIGYATIHFSRLPHYIEPAAWGILGLWLLARGLRTGSWLNLGLSGALLGVAALVAPAGLIFVAAGLLWWLGVFILAPAGLTSARPAGRRWASFGGWLLGLWVVMAPLLGTWLHAPERFRAYLRAPALMDAVAFTPGASLFGLNLRRTLFAFNYAADASSAFGFPDHLLHSLVAPLFILAIGVLLVNLDAWAGWTLLSWLTAGLVIAAGLSPRAPFVPVMIPLLPVAALAVAFAMDRVRATAVAALGSWINQAVVIVAAGLILWVGVNSWLAYYQFAGVDSEADGGVVSPVARVAHESENATELALVYGFSGQSLSWSDPALAMVSADLPVDQHRLALGPDAWSDAWPDGIDPGVRFLVQPADRALLEEIEQRYPGGRVTLQRDLRGDPVVYIIDW
jgi:hypothetical protein